MSAIGGGGGGTLRTPSWTDRVLTHSLPGKAPLLRWRAYDMADDVGLSDHRPVSARLTLFVDADFPPPPASASPRSPRAGLALFLITIPRAPVVTLQRRGGGVMPPPSSEMSILFPLTGEDPIAEQRKASSLGEVSRKPHARTLCALINNAGRSSICQHTQVLKPHNPHPHKRAQVMPGVAMHRSSSTSSISHFKLAAASFPVRLRTVACPRRSEHLLLKISAGEKEVGQVCVPLALFLPTATAAAEPQEEPAAAPRAGSPLPPPAPAPLPTDPTVDPEYEEVIEGTQAGRPPRGRGAGLRFPLTSGGAFKGWVQLDMRVRVRPLEGSGV